MERIAPAGDVYQAGTLRGTRSPRRPARHAAPARRARVRQARPVGATLAAGLAGRMRPAWRRAPPPSPASRPSSSPPNHRATTRRPGRATRTPTPPSAARCSSAGSTCRRRSSRPGSRRWRTPMPTWSRPSRRRARPSPSAVSALAEVVAAADPALAPYAVSDPSGPLRRRRRDPRLRARGRLRGLPDALRHAARLQRHGPDLRLLAGDALYALGLSRLAEAGDLEAVAILSI